jgi:hypothetical protein
MEQIRRLLTVADAMACHRHHVHMIACRRRLVHKKLKFFVVPYRQHRLLNCPVYQINPREQLFFFSVASNIVPSKMEKQGL